MNPKFKYLFVLLLTWYQLPAQVSILGVNGGTAAHFVGWDNSMNTAVKIKHEGNYPINFYTNAGAGGFANMRMFIESTGNVGIGNFATANTLLHIHQNGENPVDFQMTDRATGGSTTDGFEMEYHANGYFNMTQNEFVPFDIRTQGTDGNEYRRIRIWAADTVGQFFTSQHTRVGIFSGVAGGYEASNSGTPVVPLSMLHIGDGGSYNNTANGFRTWMNYGTLVMGGSDNVFFGLKNEDANAEPAELIIDRGDAVVSWGDNSVSPDDLNDFRFIYTAIPSASGPDPRALEFDGQEMARISWNGNMGIGNFYNLLAPTGPIVRPARRLEVLDGGRNQPQFRLTFEQTGVVTGGGTMPRWTDFQTTNTGNLYINPTNNGTNMNVGINIAIPNSTLEVNSNNAGPLVGAGMSGLTFTDLTSASAGIGTNLSGKVLTVDNTGLVVLADDNVGSGGGVTVCGGGTPSNYLVKYTSSAVACSSAVYENSSAEVGIGTTSPSAKTSIVSTSSLTDGKAFSTNTNYNNGSGVNDFNNVIPSTGGALTNQTNIYAYTEGETNGGSVISGSFETYDRSTSTYASYGVKGYAQADATNTGAHYIAGVLGMGHARNSNQYVKGGSFYADGAGAQHDGVLAMAAGTSGINRGVYGHAAGAATTNYAVMAYAANATNNYGITVSASGGTANYGIYAAATGGTPTATNTAAYFNGDIFGTTANFLISDIKFKQNVQPLANATNILSQLNTKTYEFDQSGYPSLNLPTGLQYGLIAQEVEQVIPGMVRTFKQPGDTVNGTFIPEFDFKGVQYETLIPILVAGFQEQKNELDSLRQVVANFIGQPRSQELTNQNAQERVVLSNTKAIQLHQNDPNPFSESTVIRFEIPETISSARIIFTDMKGDILKTATIESRGAGSLEVFASDLSSGLYTYTLVCDGKVVDSKKMVKN